MGTKERPKAGRLPEKLLKIRNSLGLSQSEMIERLGMSGQARSIISAFERGTREPAYPVLLKYARLIKVSTDVLIDDEIELVT